MKNLLISVSLIFLFACTPSKPDSEEKKTESEQVVQGEAQGTTYTVKYIGAENSTIKQQLDSLLRKVDLSMSTYIPNSLISKLNQGDSIQIDSLFIAVFLESKSLSNLTDGAFDPTIAPLIEAWGFDFSDPQKMDSSEVTEILTYCGFNQFELKADWLVKKSQKAKLNFNAIAQGYSVDLMASILEENGINRYYVELGGEVIAKGKNKDGIYWRVGIDKPSGMNLERELSAVVSLEDEAMVTSGNYRKFVEIDGIKYNHTINPKTGFPVKHSLLSAAVIADKSSTADGLATALMVMGLEKSKSFLEKHSEFSGILIFVNREDSLETFISPELERKVEEL
tara:strand:- start:15776 stop:16792 length:1017 start_codon:yes stop_codon:yes gene_type:complete